MKLEQNNNETMTTPTYVENLSRKEELQKEADKCYSFMDMPGLSIVHNKAEHGGFQLDRDYKLSAAYLNYIDDKCQNRSDFEIHLCELEAMMEHEDFEATLYGMARIRFSSERFDELLIIDQFIDCSSTVNCDIDEFTKTSWFESMKDFINEEQRGHDMYDSEREEEL